MRGQLHHIEIYVSNFERSREFWKWLLELLGYEEISPGETITNFRLGNTYIVLVQTEEKFLDVPYHRCRTGLNHLAFHGGSRADIDALTEKLRERNIKILYEDRHPHAGGNNYYAVFFEDPDRIKVEVVASGIK